MYFVTTVQKRVKLSIRTDRKLLTVLELQRVTPEMGAQPHRRGGVVGLRRAPSHRCALLEAQSPKGAVDARDFD